MTNEPHIERKGATIVEQIQLGERERESILYLEFDVLWEYLCAAIIIFLFYSGTFLPLFMDVGMLLSYINYL